MTLRALPIALATLLAAAACAPDVKKYAPKTDDECGGYTTGLKACGYRCVPLDDPATGCWEVEGVCAPCPTGGVHTVPICQTVTTSWPSCGTACAAGWGDCNGQDADGCETDLNVSAGNCGACGRACTTCTDGLCPAAQIGDALPHTPVGIDQAQGAIVVIDQGNGGEIFKVGSPHVPYVTGLGAVRRVRMLYATTGWVSGTEFLSPDTYGTLWLIEKPSTDVVATWLANTTGTITDFALTYDASAAPNRIAYAASDGTGYRTVLAFSSAGTSTNDSGDTFTALAGDPTGGYEVYAGGPYTGGTGGMLSAWTPSSSSGLGLDPIPTRLAAFVDGAGYVTVFSASASDGSVSLWAGGNSIDRVIPGAGPTAGMDIHADADGVYWSDATAGVVRRWRATDGFVYDVARGGQPVAITSDATRVIWADAASNTVQSAPK